MAWKYKVLLPDVITLEDPPVSSPKHSVKQPLLLGARIIIGFKVLMPFMMRLRIFGDVPVPFTRQNSRKVNSTLTRSQTFWKFCPPVPIQNISAAYKSNVREYWLKLRNRKHRLLIFRICILPANVKSCRSVQKAGRNLKSRPMGNNLYWRPVFPMRRHLW
jgi:hypothetical protein